jgi:predicted small secreted protein
MHRVRRSAALAVAGLALATVLAGCAARTTDGSGRTAPPVGHSAPAPPVSTSTPAPNSGSSPSPATPVDPPAGPAVAAHRRAVNHCARNAGGKLVLVSIRAQHVWMCAGRHTAFSTPVTTGAVGLAYDATPTGNFQIQGRDRDTTLTLNTGQTYQVKYWIPFSAPLFGFHDASWQKFPFGSPRYRTHGSHGCVHMPLRAMRFLYQWGTIGTPVHIRG